MAESSEAKAEEVTKESADDKKGAKKTTKAKPKATPKPKAKKAAPKKTPKAKPTKSKPAAKKKEPKKKIDQSTKEIRWTSKKVSIIEAFKKAGAVNSASAKTLDEISEKSGVKLSILTHQCNPKFDLSVQEFIKRVVQEGTRKYCFYLTKKGVKLSFDK